MNETINYTESTETRHSRVTFLSNASGLLCSTLIGSIQGFTIVYYETVLGLNAWLVFVAMSIFLVYNGINDPIFGFLIDRNLRFTRKWGRRFPWIVIAIVPWVFSVFLHFSAPTIATPANPWPAFGWLLLTLVLLDTFGTIVNINYKALQMEKFRTEYERQRFTKYYAPIDILAILLGMLLPSLFISENPDIAVQLASYSFMGGVVAIIALLFGILSLHGNREDKIMIDRFYSPDSVKRMNFFKVFKEALKSRTYVVYFIFGTCLGIQITLVVVNVWYLT
ncbi:MAG: MFS transporter, partial [Candidatus Lokiarchaeota archaeon]|nr:MFS transporter [Candidatus Lokiarchaeota archaeon]